MSPEVSLSSPLWEADLRDQVTGSKMANSDLNRYKSRALVPGMATAQWLGNHNVSHLPLLLIQNPGSQCGTLALLFLHHIFATVSLLVNYFEMK